MTITDPAGSTTGLASGTALVAGGSGDLGSAICFALAREGFDVCVGYHGGRDKAEAVATRIADLGGSAEPVQLDLRSDEGAVEAIRTAAARRRSGLGAVVYAAGVPGREFSFVSKTPVSEWARTLDQDVVGFLRLASAAIPELRASQGSLIALTTFQAARVEVRGGLSSVPKAAIEAAVRAIAREEGRNGLRANAVRVGLTDSGTGATLAASSNLAELTRDIALRRLGKGDEVGNAVAFLASRQSSFITGAMLPVDGGHGL